MSLPQTLPVESEIFNPPTEDSLNIQEPPVETRDTFDPFKNDPQPLSMQKEPVINPLSHPTPLSSKPDLKQSEPNITQAPHASEAKPVKTLTPTKKQPDSKLLPAPVQQQPAKATPAVPEIAPLATTEVSQKKPLKSPASLQPAKETIPIKAEPTESAASLEEMNRDPSDAEVEELLQSLDAPTADLSLITEP
jgi:hypothetical protein